MNDIVTMADQLPSDVDFNAGAFNSFTQELLGGDPVVRFIKVGWYYQSGDEKVSLDNGVEVVLNPMKSRTGWLRFDNKNTLVERRLGMIAENHRPEPREDLGFTDDTDWKKNDEGDPQDPWTQTVDIPGVLVGEKGNYKVNVGGTSWAWRKATGKLFQQWMSQRATNDGKVPLVKLKSTTVEGRRGPQQVPIMDIDRWVDPTAVEVVEAPEQESEKDKAKKKQARF